MHRTMPPGHSPGPAIVGGKRAPGLARHARMGCFSNVISTSAPRALVGNEADNEPNRSLSDRERPGAHGIGTLTSPSGEHHGPEPDVHSMSLADVVGIAKATRHLDLVKMHMLARQLDAEASGTSESTAAIRKSEKPLCGRPSDVRRPVASKEGRDRRSMPRYPWHGGTCCTISVPPSAFRHRLQ